MIQYINVLVLVLGNFSMLHAFNYVIDNKF